MQQNPWEADSYAVGLETSYIATYKSITVLTEKCHCTLSRAR